MSRTEEILRRLTRGDVREDDVWWLLGYAERLEHSVLYLAGKLAERGEKWLGGKLDSKLS